MIKKILLTTLLSLLAFNAFAADFKIGVIDLRKVVQGSPRAAAINKKLEKEFKKRQNKIVADQKQLEKDITKLNKNKAVMKAAKRTDLQEKIIRQRRDLQRQSQDYQQDFTLTRNRAMQEYLASYLPKVKAAIDKIAKSGKYDMILQKEVVPFSKANYEITNQVVKALK